jgi:sugar lactone lactonase YvrE
MLLKSCVVLLLSLVAAVPQDDPLFTAVPVTQPGEFTPGIEGPACDREGRILAVNFVRQGTIGRVTPEGRGEVLLELSNGSVGNGIRFDQSGRMFIADYVNHNVLIVEQNSRSLRVFAHEAAMSQPNDLAITADGTLYASDPAWDSNTGRIWRIDRAGKVTLAAKDLGTTNGLDVSPDGRTLYVNESVQRGVWAFPIAADGSLGIRRLIKQFPDHGFDGMRCDVDGNLYITRYGKGTVIRMTPAGEILNEIDVLGHSPSNLCFGGPDGCTVYVTEVEHRRLVRFRVDRPGLEWQRLQSQR